MRAGQAGWATRIVAEVMEPYWRKTRRQRWAEAAASARSWLAGLPPPVRVVLVLVAAVLVGICG